MADTTKRMAGYVRVSVDNETKVSPEIQAEAIEQYCKLKGWELVHLEIERGRSAGEGKKRPGLDRVRKLIRTRKASGLIVWKIDRCSRSVRDFSEILAELQKYRADFVSVTESFDTSSAMGVAMLQITMVFAQLERSRSSERLTAWHTWRAKQGLTGGKPPLGYRNAGDGSWVTDEETGPLMKRAIELYLDTKSTTIVQRFLADHGYPKDLSGIRSLLSSTTLAGIRVVDGVTVPGVWPALIDVATRERVLATLAGTRGAGQRGRPNRPRQLLTSIAMCGRCDLPMRLQSGVAKTGVRDKYRCSSYSRKRDDSPGCGLAVWAEPAEAHVEKMVLADITPEKWRRMRARRQAAPAPVFIDNVALEAKLAGLAEDWAHDRITEGEWHAARDALMRRMAETETELDVELDADETELPDVDDLHKAWPKLSIEAKRLVITADVERIVVNPGFIVPGRRNGWAPIGDRIDIFWR